MKLLVCGGRDFSDFDYACSVLDRFHAKYPVDIVIQGGQRGADMIAHDWAHSRAIHSATVMAQWNYHRRAAGPLRNAAMLMLGPDAVLAFPGGPGTAGMCRLAEAAGIKVWKIEPRS